MKRMGLKLQELSTPRQITLVIGLVLFAIALGLVIYAVQHGEFFHVREQL